MSLSDPEGYIDSSDYPPLPLNNFLECTYNVTVYTGYGVELQVTQRGPLSGCLFPQEVSEGSSVRLTVTILAVKPGQFEPGFGG